MRSLTPARCLFFKLNYLKSSLSKSSLRNFKRVYTFGKSSFLKSLNSIRLRTKYFCQKVNFHSMSTLRTTTNVALSITETTNEVVRVDSHSVSSNHRGDSKKEEEKPRRHIRKESININMENHKPNSFATEFENVNNSQGTDKKSRTYRQRPSTSRFTHERNNLVWPTFSNFRNTYVNQSNLLQNPDFFRFSNVFYHSLADFRLYNVDHRSNAADYSNSTRAAQLDKQQAWALRTWQRTPLGKHLSKKKPSSKSCVFKIMTYNVLAQDLLEEHGHLYRGHNPDALVWEQRWITLFEEFKHHNADILCFQEVQASHVENFYNKLHELGYKGIFKQKTGRRTDGCAIYYKRSMFKLIEHTTVEFKQSSIGVLNRDNIAIIAKFAPRKNKENEFVVATTHLLYNPKREDVRLAQTQVLLSEVDRIAYIANSTDQNNHVPLIITGDFNFSPDSAIYQLLETRTLKYDDLTKKSLCTRNTSDSKTIGKKLLPSSLRITDQCQHADLVEHRIKNNPLKRDDELKLIQLYHSERESQCKRITRVDKILLPSGTLTHNFILNSAYKHNNGDDTEATTYQSKWVTVDYIFYSNKLNKTGKKQDDKLKLLSRYKLPTTRQLEGIRIPNFAFGSDHFLLLVTFQLDP